MKVSCIEYISQQFGVPTSCNVIMVNLVLRSSTVVWANLYLGQFLLCLGRLNGQKFLCEFSVGQRRSLCLRDGRIITSQVSVILPPTTKTLVVAAGAEICCEKVYYVMKNPNV